MTRLQRMLLIFSIALSLRILFLIALPWENRIVDGYDKIAVSMLSGRGFSFDGVVPTVARAPAYPTYLFVLFHFLGSEPIPYFQLRLADILLDCITSALVYCLASKWFPHMSARLWFVSGMVYALNPFAAFYTIKLGSETLTSFILVTYLIFLSKALLVDNSGAGNSAIAAICGGLLALSRSSFLVFAVATPFILIMVGGNRTARHSWNALLCVIITLALTTPWSLRNTQLSGRFVPIQTLTGYGFWYDFTLDRNRNAAIWSGNLDSVCTGGQVFLPDGSPYSPPLLPPTLDALHDSQLTKLAAQWTLQNPGKFFLKCLDNLLSFWYLLETPRKMIVGLFFSLITIFSSLLGFKRLIGTQDGKGAICLLVLILFLDLLYSPFLAVFRYSVATYPLFAQLAAPSVGEMIGAIRGRWPLHSNLW